MAGAQLQTSPASSPSRRSEPIRLISDSPNPQDEPTTVRNQVKETALSAPDASDLTEYELGELPESRIDDDDEELNETDIQF